MLVAQLNDRVLTTFSDTITNNNYYNYVSHST